MLCKRSAARTNNKGERASPCLTPLLQWKSLPRTPFNRTAEVQVERVFLIHKHHLLGKPLASKICTIAECSTISKAFSKSSLRIMISLLEWWHWWRYSKAQPKQSCIVLLCRNPYWFLWITWRITLCSLLARILVMNFIEELRSEMGLKSTTLSGFAFLGTRVIYE